MPALLLVLEDEPVLRISLVRGLSKLSGVTAVGAATIAEALEIIDNEPPQLIVSDIDLPDGLGLELVSVLDRKSLKVPVIYASAYVAEYRVQIPSRSNVSVLEKPVPLAKLRKIVTDRLSVASEGGIETPPFDATDYLQLACMCRKSVEIVMHNGTEELGHILIREGELWSAQMGDKQGGEALRGLVFATGLSVSCVGIRRPETERTIHQSWEALLLEAARIHDEASTAAESGSDAPVTFDFNTIDDAEPTSARPEPVVEDPSEPATLRSDPLPPEPHEPDPVIEFDYQKRERRLREYERSQHPDRNIEEPESVEPVASSYIEVRFAELYEQGVDALLDRDYPRALEVFRECHSLVPSDPRVVANLKRLKDMGYTTGDDR